MGHSPRGKWRSPILHMWFSHSRKVRSRPCFWRNLLVSWPWDFRKLRSLLLVRNVTSSSFFLETNTGIKKLNKTSTNIIMNTGIYSRHQRKWLKGTSKKEQRNLLSTVPVHRWQIVVKDRYTGIEETRQYVYMPNKPLNPRAQQDIFQDRDNERRCMENKTITVLLDEINQLTKTDDKIKITHRDDQRRNTGHDGVIWLTEVEDTKNMKQAKPTHSYLMG